MNKIKFDAAQRAARELKFVERSDNPHIMYANLELEGQQWSGSEWHYKPFDRPKLARLEREQLIAWQNGAFYNPVDMALIRQKREKWERKDAQSI